MDFDLTIVLALGGLGVLGGIFFLRQRAQAQRSAALAAMAARRGWDIAMEGRHTALGIAHLSGREEHIVVTPKDGQGWRCDTGTWDEEATNPHDESEASVVRRRGLTEFADAACKAPEGFALAIALPASADIRALSSPSAQGLPDSFRKAVFERMFGEFGPAAALLQPLEGPEAVQGRLSLFATGSMPSEIDLGRIAAATDAWQSRHGGEASPILLWRGDGLRVRMRVSAVDAGRLEHFVQTALEMREAVRHAS